jgi:hypothetical protein
MALVLVRECGVSKISWFWSSDLGDYVKRERGISTRLTPEEFLADVVDYPEAHRCDGLQKWIEAGRPR